MQHRKGSTVAFFRTLLTGAALTGLPFGGDAFLLFERQSHPTTSFSSKTSSPMTPKIETRLHQEAPQQLNGANGGATTTKAASAADPSASGANTASGTNTTTFKSSIFTNVLAAQEKQTKERDINTVATNNTNGSISRAFLQEMQESIDVSREGTRMDSLDSYIVVSILTSTASFATVKGLSDDASLEFTTTILSVPTLIHVGTVLVSTASAFSGIYATVVFSLCAAYGRTSIGMGKDKMYEAFMNDTGSLRAKGFDAYLLSLSLFLAEMVLISSTKLNHELQPLFLLATTFAAVIMYRDWTEIMNLAKPLFTMDCIACTARLHGKTGDKNDNDGAARVGTGETGSSDSLP